MRGPSSLLRRGSSGYSRAAADKDRGRSSSSEDSIAKTAAAARSRACFQSREGSSGLARFWQSRSSAEVVIEGTESCLRESVDEDADLYESRI
eukprot:1662841-Prymnesium_polylepis.1